MELHLETKTYVFICWCEVYRIYFVNVLRLRLNDLMSLTDKDVVCELSSLRV